MCLEKNFFSHPGPKVPRSGPAQKRECVIFGLGARKNYKFSRDMGCQSLLLPKCLIYYYFFRDVGGIVYTHLRRKKFGQSRSRVNCHPSRRLPWSVYYFSSYASQKYHIRVFEPGAKVATFGQGIVKNNFGN